MPCHRTNSLRCFPGLYEAWVAQQRRLHVLQSRKRALPSPFWPLAFARLKTRGSFSSNSGKWAINHFLKCCLVMGGCAMMCRFVEWFDFSCSNDSMAASSLCVTSWSQTKFARASASVPASRSFCFEAWRMRYWRSAAAACQYQLWRTNQSTYYFLAWPLSSSPSLLEWIGQTRQHPTLFAISHLWDGQRRERLFTIHGRQCVLPFW